MMPGTKPAGCRPCGKLTQVLGGDPNACIFLALGAEAESLSLLCAPPPSPRKPHRCPPKYLVRLDNETESIGKYRKLACCCETCRQGGPQWKPMDVSGCSAGKPLLLIWESPKKRLIPGNWNGVCRFGARGRAGSVRQFPPGIDLDDNSGEIRALFAREMES